MLYQREDMIGQFYQWDLGEGQMVFSGSPTRKAFDRFNGHQVLYIINYYATLFDNFSKEHGQRVEKMISNDLPPEVKSELSVFNWISVAAKKAGSAV